MKPANGAVLYHGPSRLDGAPIVAIVTGLAQVSVNRKTGNMLQTFILRRDVAPEDAVRTGADASICGDCRHRWFNRGACYVDVHRAPAGVWRAWHRGSYPAARLGLASGRIVRLGTYGDPAAVPVGVWQALLQGSTGHTGYTHQWRTAPDALRALCMASVDSAQEMAEARALDWRTFRVRTPGESLAPREFTCPASDEAGHRTTCSACRACDGSGPRGAAQASAAIIVHGILAKRFAQKGLSL